MILPEQFVVSLRADALKKAKNKKRVCLVYNCQKDSILSHVIWKKGILSKIAERNNHLIELNVQKRFRHEKLSFTLTGINEILAFKGFCNYHDNLIFSGIEKSGVDFHKYKNQILVCVRGMYYERRKKEINIDKFYGTIKENILPYQEQIDFLKDSIYQHELGIKDIGFYTSELNKEYIKPMGRFYFKTFELPIVPVISSSMFHVDSYETMERNYTYDDDWEDIPLNSILFSLFPYEGKSYFIIGFHANYLQNMPLIHGLSKMTQTELLQFVSDILIERVESWACSPSFYEKHLKEIEQIILDYFDEDPNDFSLKSQKRINIFEKWVKGSRTVI